MQIRVEFWPPGSRGGRGWQVLPAPGSPIKRLGPGAERLLLDRYTAGGTQAPRYPSLWIEGTPEEFEGEATPRW